MEQDDLQRAHPEARRSALLLVAVVAGAGLLLIWLLQLELSSLQAASSEGDWDRATAGYQRLFAAAFGLMTIAGLGSGAYIWRLSTQVLREQRHPPANARLIRDMPIVRGAAAVRIGRIGRALAIAFFVVTIAGAGIGMWLLASLG